MPLGQAEAWWPSCLIILFWLVGRGGGREERRREFFLFFFLSFITFSSHGPPKPQANKQRQRHDLPARRGCSRSGASWGPGGACGASPSWKWRILIDNGGLRFKFAFLALSLCCAFFGSGDTESPGVDGTTRERPQRRNRGSGVREREYSFFFVSLSFVSPTPVGVFDRESRRGKKIVQKLLSLKNLPTEQLSPSPFPSSPESKKMASHLASLGKVGPTIGECSLELKRKRALGEQERGGIDCCGRRFSQSRPRKKKLDLASSLFSLSCLLSPPPSHAAPTPHPTPPRTPPPPHHTTSGLFRPRGPLRLRPAEDLQPPLARVDPVVRGRLEAAGRSQAQVDGARGGSGNHGGLRPGQEGRLEEREKER